MSSTPPRPRWKAALSAAAVGVGALARRHRAPRDPPPPPPPPVTTMSSPGQIADLQQAYGADMAPTAGAPSAHPEQP